MSHTGVEAKPTWRAMPRLVREGAEQLLGARVARAMRVWGGYTPNPTFRIRLDDGRRAFLKAVGPGSNVFSRAAHEREERVYRDLGDVVRPWAPEHIGSFDVDGWRALVLEDVGPKSAPPWTQRSLRGVARELGRFHAATADQRIPDWVPRTAVHPAMGISDPAWRFAATDLRRLGALAGDPDAAGRWLRAYAPALAAAAARLDDPRFRTALLHVDVRSDNLRWTGGRLVLFDWPHVGVGPPEFDAVAFAQTVPLEGGPDPERVVAWYGETWEVDPAAVDASVASIAGYFADHAWAGEIPGLPRVRTFQRRQLAVSLRWAARRLGLPEPTWVDHLRVGDYAQ